ncbi:MAG TPA: transglutaminase-like domain-containing protein [Solirubrobacteraceae bacterium]|nr:transglutaminase-like domain-containing protein [Solirubrobacteraceae bacterium]
MSSTTQVAVLAPLGTDAGPSRVARRSGDRPFVRLFAFTALGLYGVLRWGTLMKPAPTWRLIGLLVVAVVLAGIGPALLERERAVAAAGGRGEPVSALGAPLALLAVLLIFPLAGMPVAWIIHLRVAVIADGIGQGLSALPGILVPYSGVNEWARVVMLLGAAVLLLDAGLLLAFAPPALGDVRRAGAALPLIALVVVPATLVHPHLAYLQGLILFALLAFFMWGERVAPDRWGSVVLACAATGAIGMIVAPALDQHSPWIDYEALTRGFTPAHVERFDWTQRYGPLVWPRTGKDVLEVKASPKAFVGEYWKTENLDTFDGRGWSSGSSGGAAPEAVSAATFRKYTQTLTVTIRAMTINQVVAAGYAGDPPQHLASPPLPGSSTGTWAATTPLGPGDAYTVSVYVPHPGPRALARAGENYPSTAKDSDLALSLPQVRGPQGVLPQSIQFPAFGSGGAPENQDQTGRTGPSAAVAIQNSPYAPAYALSQRLLRGARTPYAYARSVMKLLAGYTYDEDPPPVPYPLETFLFSNKIGYCQQFAGSMAMLLRMGGIPARVATGFTTGTFDTATKSWLVTDIDAHAWVEAWFPGYGWVTFDPTPAQAPARGGHASINSQNLLGGTGGLSKLGGRDAGTPSGTARGTTHVQSSDSSEPILLGILGVLAILLALALLAWSRTSPLDADGLLAELERALSRSGRPISDGVTLAALERRFRTSPEAARYVHALRMARFGNAEILPTLRQRRALRAQLRAGLGLGGAVRALWALPPRPKRSLRRPRRQTP